MRRGPLSWLLAVLLVLVQQGALRHELGHLTEPQLSCRKEAQPAPDHCPTCLALAHLFGVASPAPMLDGNPDVAFALVSEEPHAEVSPIPAAPRSRGPPES